MGVVPSKGQGVDDKVKGILKIAFKENEGVGLEEFAPKGDYPFTDISWYSAEGGYFTGADGKRERFACGNVSAIIYFDKEYTQRLEMQYESFREEIKSRETVVNLVFNEVLTGDEFSGLQASKAKLDQANSDAVRPYSDMLDGYISKFKGGQRRINGKWIAQTQNTAEHVYGPLDISRGVGQVRYVGVYIVFDPADLGLLYVLTPTGGECLSLDATPVDLPTDVSKYPPALIQQILQSQVSQLTNAITNGSGINSQFLQQAESLGEQTRNFPAMQKQLADAVMASATNSLIEPAKRALMINEWPKLVQSVSLTEDQQADFYTKLIGQAGLSREEARAILAKPLPPDAPSRLKNEIANWNQQFSDADKLDDKMEQKLMEIFNKPENSILTQDSGHREDLAKPISMPSDADSLFDSAKDQVARSTLDGCKAGLQAYEEAWSQLKGVVQARVALAHGNLGETGPLIATLNKLSDLAISPTPAQKAVAQAAILVTSLYKAQKDEEHRLLDEAERLRALGGQTAKALQDYKNAYQLDNDPQTLQKIKDLNNESLGL